MKRKTLFYVLTLVIAMILLAACGSSSDDSSSGSDSNNAESEEKTYTFKLGHEAKEGHVKYATAEKFKEELEARSNLLNDYTVQLRLPFVNVVGFYSLNFEKILIARYTTSFVI